VMHKDVVRTGFLRTFLGELDHDKGSHHLRFTARNQSGTLAGRYSRPTWP
jgi:hypothetical protein